MFKKLSACILAAALTFSLTGCGEDIESFYSLMEDALTMENGVIELDASVRDMSTDNIIANFSMDGRFNEYGDISVDVGYKMSNDEINTNGVVSTSAILSDNTLYFDIGTLLTTFGNCVFDNVQDYSWLFDVIGDTQWVYLNASEALTDSKTAPDFDVSLDSLKEEVKTTLAVLQETCADCATISDNNAELHLTSDNIPDTVDLSLSEFEQLNAEIRKRGSIYYINIDYTTPNDLTFTFILNMKSSSNLTRLNAPTGATSLTEMFTGHEVIYDDFSF